MAPKLVTSLYSKGLIVLLILTENGHWFGYESGKKCDVVKDNGSSMTSTCLSHEINRKGKSIKTHPLFMSSSAGVAIVP